MPKGNRGGRRTVTPTPTGPRNYTAYTDADAKQVRDDTGDRYTPSVLDAIKQYISKADMGNGYSMSQEFNHKLNNKLPLNANEKFMDKYLAKGMHDLGKDTILYRGAHDDILKTLGIKNYQNMTEQQLQNALIGVQYKTKSYTSASYDRNKNPFYTGPNSGGREIEMVIKAPAKTQMVFGAKSQAETIINKGTEYKITGVKYTGRQATPRNVGLRPVLQLEVEIV